MGTSASSSGPGSGVPLIPPWVSDPDSPLPDDPSEGEDEENGNPQDPPPQVAPTGRFRGARVNLGGFAGSGSDYSLRRGIGQYVRAGLGGSRNGTRRMGGTARKAGALYGVLQALSRGTTPSADLGLDVEQLSGLPAREIIDRIAEAVSPSDGSLDSETSRYSLSQALSELIRMDPSIDLAALTLDQIILTMELFISADICRRIEVDVGKTILDRATDAATAVRRLGEMYRYVRQVVASAFRRRSNTFDHLTERDATRLASGVIMNTLEVFESYLS